MSPAKSARRKVQRQTANPPSQSAHLAGISAPPFYDIYLTARGDTIRYALGRTGYRPLLIIGLNPSTANQYTRDQTLTRVERFTQRRANSLIMCNLYPLRATNPNDLPHKANAQLIQQNIDCIYALARDIDPLEIWAAWGTPIEKRPYLFNSLAQLHNHLTPLSPHWLQCGPPTQKGHPRHPSRLGYKHHFSIFDIDSYLDLHSPSWPLPGDTLPKLSAGTGVGP